MILGLLISLAAPRIIGRTDDARVVKAMADMRAIEEALDLYRLDTGSYPGTELGLEVLVEPGLEGRSGGYLERVPLDPWNSPFLFASDSRKYVLQSLGADGEEGGDGVDADIDSRDF